MIAHLLVSLLSPPFLLALLLALLVHPPTLAHAHNSVPAPLPAADVPTYPPPVDVTPVFTDSAIAENFGQAVAISGDWLAIGAAPWGKTGAVTLYQRSPATGGWTTAAILLPPGDNSDAMRMAMFGTSLALDGDTLVVGAPGVQPTLFAQGAVYLYRLTDGAWTHAATLLPSDPAMHQLFGEHVALWGRSVVATTAATGADTAAAYLFDWSPSGAFTQTETIKLVPSLEPGELAGNLSIAIAGDRVTIGAPAAASAFLFARDAGGAGAWGEVAAVKQPQPSSFGASVALHGDLWAIGDAGSPGDAAVYLYTPPSGAPGAWQPLATLLPPPGITHFGSALAVDDNLVLVGGSDSGSWPGGAFVYLRNHGGLDAWGLTMRLLPGNLYNHNGAGTGFGGALALAHGAAVVAAQDARAFAIYSGIAARPLVSVQPIGPYHFQGQNVPWVLGFYNPGPPITGAALLGSLPSSLTLATPVELAPPQPGAILAQDPSRLPELATGLALTPAAWITVSFKTLLAADVPAGVPITATFTLSHPSASAPLAPTVAVALMPRRNQAHLPLLAAPYPIYLPPGYYSANRCDDTPLYIRGIHVGQIFECVTGVLVRPDGMLQFNFAWSVDIKPGVPPIIKYPDTDNRAMYIVDNLGNRVDHVAVGGAAAEGTSIDNGVPVYGWFLFTPAVRGAHTFTFHDDNLSLLMENISLLP